MNKRFSLDRKFGWLAFPGLIRSIASLQLVFFVLLIFRPEALEILFLDREKIHEGQIWRIVSFIFLPLVHPYSSFGLFVNCLFAYFAFRISYIINDVLEAFWGELRTTLFVYAVILSQAAVYYFLFFLPFGPGGANYYLTLFFAFATLQPKYTFLLFLIIPVPAWLFAAMGVVNILSVSFSVPFLAPFFLLFYLGIHSIYLFWAIPKLIRWMRNRGKVRVRRAKFEAGRPSKEQTLHRCAECGRTEISDPELDFRVSADGEEYCLDHLKKSDKGSAP